jgi:hypothetical protein
MVGEKGGVKAEWRKVKMFTRLNRHNGGHFRYRAESPRWGRPYVFRPTGGGCQGSPPSRSLGESREVRPAMVGGTPALIFNASTLISRRLEQKKAFLAPFLTLNHLDFQVLTKKVAKKNFP